MNLRLSILLVVVLIIFGGTFLVLRFTDSNERDNTRPWLYRIDEGSIVKLEVVYQGEAVNYYRNLASLDWYIEGDPEGGPEGNADIPVFQQQWGGTPLLLSGPRVNRALSDTIDDPAGFGLEPPETSVKVFDRFGNEVEFHLGIPTPDKKNQYARLVGDDALFTVPIEWAQVVSRLAIDPPVGRLYDVDPRSVMLVQFFRGDDTARYGTDETGRWFLDGDPPKPVDPDSWAESLLMLSNPRMDQIIYDVIDDPGLEPPDTAVVIIRQGGQPAIEFHIGDVTPDGNYRYVSVIAGGSVESQDTNLYGVLTSRIDPIIALATDPVLEEEPNTVPHKAEGHGSRSKSDSPQQVIINDPSELNFTIGDFPVGWQMETQKESDGGYQVRAVKLGTIIVIPEEIVSSWVGVFPNSDAAKQDFDGRREEHENQFRLEDPGIGDSSYIYQGNATDEVILICS